MALENGEAKGGMAVWRLTPGGLIVIPNVLLDAAGNIVIPANQANQETLNSLIGGWDTSGLPTGNNIIGQVKITDGTTVAGVQSTTANLNVHAADSHFSNLNLHLKNDTGTSETMGAGGASAGDFSFDVAAGQGGTFSANDRITIVEGTTQESSVIKIISVAGDTLTIDLPLENDYSSAAIVEITDINLGVNGSVTPVVFSITPPSNQVWHLHTFIFHIEDGPEPGIELFGGISALSKGVVVRCELSTGNLNHVIVRTNGDMKEYFGGTNVEFVQKVGGGDYATNALWDFRAKTHAIVRLDGAQGDTFKAIVQDDLSALTFFEFIAQGHLEEG